MLGGATGKFSKLSNYICHRCGENLVSLSKLLTLGSWGTLSKMYMVWLCGGGRAGGAKPPTPPPPFTMNKIILKT